ncbi:MAG: PilZ domain-containing protein [Candidatus Omnitrophica bacterium]|nr:PilZ domain-containing protein [Candidatus Omnitrophota bacterium]
MIYNKSMEERRQHQRFNNHVPVKICHEDGDIVTETANISRAGAYCRVSRYFMPMMKLKIHLLLPLRKNGKDASRKITIGGVVIRTEPIWGEDFYNIAIFFNDVSQRDSKVISDYMDLYAEQV